MARSQPSEQAYVTARPERELAPRSAPGDGPGARPRRRCRGHTDADRAAHPAVWEHRGRDRTRSPPTPLADAVRRRPRGFARRSSRQPTRRCRPARPRRSTSPGASRAAAQLDLSDELLTPADGDDGRDRHRRAQLRRASRASRSCARSSPSCSGSSPAQVVAGGNSSLTMMHDTSSTCSSRRRGLTAAVVARRRRSRFICPVPGYDRHFTMLAVVRHRDGHRADARRRPRRRGRRARSSPDDPSVKGIWVVPTYANPSGAVVYAGGGRPPGLDGDGRARLQDLLGQRLRLPPPHRGRGQERRHPQPGGRRRATRTGRSCSPRPRRSPTPAPAWPSSRRRPRPSTWYLGHLAKGSIGPDKVNQLRHAQFFGSAQGVRDHMRQAPRDHRAEVRRGGASALRAPGRPRRRRRWTHARPAATSSASTCSTAPPRASSQLAKEAGIALTPAGASFPRGNDPRDRNIRLAPTFPELRRGHARRWRPSPPACASPPPRSCLADQPRRARRDGRPEGRLTPLRACAVRHRLRP